MHYLDFETSIKDLELKIEDLKSMSSNESINIVEEISRLQSKLDKLLQQTYTKLTPWQKVLVARHPERPHIGDFIKHSMQNFQPLCGDRLYAEDSAIIGGLGAFNGHSIMLIGTEKGKDTEERIQHNFGMSNPEGYRKAQRLMILADRFQVPIVTIVDTAGADPRVGAEERGQAEAIARSIAISLDLKVPFVSVIMGEGGSGGAIALATANRVLMLEHSIYSVITPEGCASILWRDAKYKSEAATAQKLTAQDLLKFKIIDQIIKEPVGGAHRNIRQCLDATAQCILKHLEDLKKISGSKLEEDRQEKFLAMGRSLT